MNRRDTLLALLALGAAAGPRVAIAQASPRMPTLGYLSLLEASTQGPWDQTSFAVELKKLGWVEGKNIRIERAYADKKYERLSVLAADLVRKKVDLIYAVGPYPALAAAHATKTIPIVFFGPTIPVEMPTRYELFVNGKTAKALGLTIPQSILARADQVIQ